MSFDDGPAVVELEVSRPKRLDLGVINGNGNGSNHRRGRVSAKKAKSPKLSPALSPRAKSKSPKISPRLVTTGLRHATAALLMDTLELPSALVKSAKRAELEHLNRKVLLSRCSRYTFASQRAPRLFHHAHGSRAVC